VGQGATPALAAGSGLRPLPGSGGGSPYTGDTAHSGGTCCTLHTWTVSSSLCDVAHKGPQVSGTSLCLHKVPQCYGAAGGQANIAPQPTQIQTQ
jgi:hypothetical protein